MGIRVFHRDQPTGTMPMIASDARLIVWPGVDCWDANMNFVIMGAGEENIPHIHAESEDTIFVLSGRGTVRDLDNDTVLEFGEGQAVFVPVGVRHQICGNRGTDVVSVGGPCPADVGLLEKLGFDLPPRN